MRLALQQPLRVPASWSELNKYLCFFAVGQDYME